MAETAELKELMDDTAESLAQALPGPAGWSGWLVYLLEVLEVKAMDLDESHPESMELCLARLQDAIQGRLQEHRW